MNTYKYIALAALVLGFTACSQDDDFTPQQEDVVQIASANIATEVQSRVNTLEDGKTWETNDRILLVNNSRDTKNSGTYTYNGSTWSLTDGMVVYHSSEANDFTAYYPASVDYTLPTDQSDEAKIKSADRMEATATGVDKGAAVALRFVRKNAKVSITAELNNEFDSNATISSLLIAGITPYYSENEKHYTAIIAPVTNGFTVTVKVKAGEDDERTLKAEPSTKIEAGNHYTFNLAVGKEYLSLNTVSVNVWTVRDITDVDADEWLGYEFDKTTGTYDVYNMDGLESVLKRGGGIRLADDITCDNQNGLEIPSDVTLYLNGHDITGTSYLFEVSAECSLTIQGEGNITSDNTVLTVDGGTVNIENGKIDGSVHVGNGGILNVSGGEITGDINLVYSSLTITGGIINGNLYANESKVSITGGTFNFDPSDYDYVPEGYESTDNGDETWTVMASNN